MELNASWLSTLCCGISEKMSSSYCTLSPKQRNTTNDSPMAMYINALWLRKNLYIGRNILLIKVFQSGRRQPFSLNNQ